MHQLIFAALGTVLTVLWGFGFSMLVDKMEGSNINRTDGVYACIWAIGEFEIILVAVSFGGING